MKEDENIASYLLRVDEIVNTIKGLGVDLDEGVVVQKILKTLPPIFVPILLVLESQANLDNLTKDELHGIHIAYEMRTERENPP